MVAMVEMVFNGNGEDGGGLSQWWSKEMAQLVVSVFHVYGAPSSVLPACLSYKLHCTAANSATAALFSLFDVLHFTRPLWCGWLLFKFTLQSLSLARHTPRRWCLLGAICIMHCTVCIRTVHLFAAYRCFWAVLYTKHYTLYIILYTLHL